jgi:hypothetical protein
MRPIGWGAVSSRLSSWVCAGISEEMIGCTVAPVREGSGDDRLLVQGRVCARRCGRRWRMPSRQATARQMTGRSLDLP